MTKPVFMTVVTSLAVLVFSSISPATPVARTASPTITIPTGTSLPSQAELAVLTQNMTTAISQANLTGHYEVLYGLTSSTFQGGTNPTALAKSFEYFRSRHIDITFTSVLSPVWTTPPTLAGGILRVDGYYPTQPRPVWFAYIFVFENGRWRTIAIGLSLDAPLVRASVQPSHR